MSHWGQQSPLCNGELFDRKQSNYLNWKHKGENQVQYIESVTCYDLFAIFSYPLNSHINSKHSRYNVTCHTITVCTNITHTCHTHTQYEDKGNNTFSISHSEKYFATDWWETLCWVSPLSSLRFGNNHPQS